MSSAVVRSVRERVAATLDAHAHVVLAVSGGIDSCVLLDAACAVLPAERLTVATFDHATGRAATRAVRLVDALAARAGVRFVSARAGERLTTEHAWRDARWRFLRAVAANESAAIATGHTRDDAIETTLMRVLRDAGARGLCGLFAGDVLRPLLSTSRAEIERYAKARALAWIDDPSNASRAFFRNRVRHELLPALLRRDPSLADAMLDIAQRSADWRRDVDAWIGANLDVRAHGRGAVDVVVSPLLVALAPTESAVVWPAIAARAGAVLDRRGVVRASEFASGGVVGSRIDLSGGWTLHRDRDRMRLRHADVVTRDSAEPAPLAAPLSWGAWRFEESEANAATDEWHATLPASDALRVRQWRAGDRMQLDGRAAKVKHLLARAGVTGYLRARWPVVEHDGEIVWIPGVRRAPAAPDRSGRPVRTYRCAIEYR